MPATSFSAALFLIPLLVLLFSTQALAPVRRAFATRKPVVELARDERLIAVIRPDPGVLALHALGIAALVIAAALVEQVLFGASPGTAYLPLMPFALAALVHLLAQGSAQWLVTDRRVITALGASLPLSDIARITVGAVSVQLDGSGTQSVRLVGLPDAPATARLIRHALEQ
ncbi:hypothetical protein [Pararhodobacter zhoushanensis]|uniref:hypothetical protein n=1 Tax=Pararhodobacter zhoushanensis TaxID=2479545 RepID=UPI000F8E0E31|nr:hypothetical protein [Pararhodobacter zhoushanensis]